MRLKRNTPNATPSRLPLIEAKPLRTGVQPAGATPAFRARRMNALFSLGVGLLALLAAPAFGQGSSTPAAATSGAAAPEPGTQTNQPRPLVVDLTTFAASPRADAVTAFIGKETPLTAGSYPIITTSNAGFLDLYYYLILTDPLECPFPTRPLEQELKEVDGLLLELELDKALSVLDNAWTHLPCQYNTVSREVLRRLLYMVGITHFYNGNKDESTRAFLEAMAVEPSLLPLAGYAPEINDAYLEAARKLPTLIPISLDIPDSLRTEGITIDGEPLPKTAKISLRPGRHVAQRFSAMGVARTVGFEILPDEKPSLTDLIQLAPPDSPNFQREMLRTALLNSDLSVQQMRALSAYAQLKRHPYMLFVQPESSAAGGLKLHIFQPGKGLVSQIPTTLTPMPDDSPLATPPGTAGVDTSKTSTGTAGSGKTPGTGGTPAGSTGSTAQASSGQTSGGKRPGAGKTPSSTEASQWQARLAVGPRGYQSSPFMTVAPSLAFRLTPAFSVEFSVLYGMGSGNGAGPQSFFGVRPALGYQVQRENLTLHTALGLGATALDVVNDGTASRLQVSLMPELEAGVFVALGPALELGLQAGLGIAPGLMGELGMTTLWQMGLVVQRSF